MLRNAYFKSIRDLRRPIVWWSLGLFLYAFVIVLFYPSFQDIPDLNEILGDEDSIVRAFIGNVEDLASPEGFLTAEMLSFMFPLLFIVFTLWLGTSLLVGEERRGSLEVLLSPPGASVDDVAAEVRCHRDGHGGARRCSVRRDTGGDRDSRHGHQPAQRDSGIH